MCLSRVSQRELACEEWALALWELQVSHEQPGGQAGTEHQLPWQLESKGRLQGDRQHFGMSLCRMAVCMLVPRVSPVKDGSDDSW